MKKNATFRLFLSFLKGSVRYFAAGVLASLLMTGADLAIPQMIRISVDSLIGDAPLDLPAPFLALAGRLGGQAYWKDHLYLVALAVCLLAAAGAFFRWLSTCMNTRGGESLTKNLQDRLFHKILHLPFEWHLAHPAGDIIQRCTSDVQHVRSFCADQVYELFRTILLIVLAISFMSSMQGTLTLITMGFVPLIAGYSLFFHSRIGKQFQACDENEGILSAIAQENLMGVRVVRAFGAEAAEEEKFRKQNTYYTGLWIRLCVLLSWFWGLGDLASSLQVLTVVMAGALFCIRGTMTVGAYLAFISYNAMLVMPIRQLGRMIAEMSKTGVSVRRIGEILEAESEPEEEEEVPFPDGDIVFSHVSFRFGTEKVLDDVSFTVKRGQTVGILGSTGSGKSTLMHLLLRLYSLPGDQGTITIGGVDIRTIPLHVLRTHIGMVLQEPFLFSRTIGENIQIAGPRSREELGRAVRLSALTETIESFPEGYDTLVGERGVTLSGGQKQRAAIARMLMQKGDICVFDDSLSAVDAQTDSQIRHALSGNLKGATVFLIAHRISTIMDADRIFVLHRGRLAEEGTHASLTAAGGIYQRIFALQTAAGEEDA